MGAFVDGRPRELPGAEADGTIFGGAIRLDAWRFREGHILELQWALTQEIAGDLRVFAIVLRERYQPGADFEIIMQADNAPRASLGYLEAGERFITRHEFQPPAGYAEEHNIYIGWYDEDVRQRLAAPYPADMLELSAIRFAASQPNP